MKISKKNISSFLKLVIIIGIFFSLFGGWSTQRQSDFNVPFWGSGRLINGLGVAFMIFALIFWELFIGKNGKKWEIITCLVSVIIGGVMINGILGTIASSITMISMVVLLILDYYNILRIRKDE